MAVDPRALGDLDLLEQLGIAADAATSCATDESVGVRFDGPRPAEIQIVRDDVVGASYRRGERVAQLVRRLAMRHERATEVPDGAGWADTLWRASDPERTRCYAARGDTIAWAEIATDPDAAAAAVVLRALMTRARPVN